MDTKVTDPLIGTLIDGRYRIRTRVARGGMATVYAAADERLERTVAVKVIHPAQAGDPQFLDRFLNEAKTIAQLTHPNVVAVYDQGSHLGLPYLVMEFVRGQTLRDVLTSRRRLSPMDALAILEQMLAAIAAAHRTGLVHRDVKPENVLVSTSPGATSPDNLLDAVVKVADFGLAGATEPGAETSDNTLMATVAYVAPELVTNGHADPRTDVYAAGIVLFEMLTGRVPYEGDRPVDIAWQHVDHDVPPPSKFVIGLPVVLDELVARATRRDPGGRPTDAGSMLAEVQIAREDLGMESARARVASQPTMMVPSIDPHRPHATLTGAAHTAGAASTYPADDAPTTQFAAATMTAGSNAARPHWARLHESTTPSSRGHGARRRVTAAPDNGPAQFLRSMIATVTGHPRGRQAMMAALVSLGLLVILGGWWFGLGRYTTAPALISMTRAQAIQEAQSAGLTLRYDTGRYDEKTAKDTVLGQRPNPNQKITRGGVIMVTLSLGPERYPVPDVVGKRFEVAVDELGQARLTVKRTDRYDDVMPAGNVLAVDPAVGTTVAPGTPITVTVSRGRAPITVPKVTGKKLDEARRMLEVLGLVVTVTQADSPKPKDEVLSQTPGDGAGLEKGQTVALSVSNGPPLVPVPAVTGQRCNEAKALLTAAGFAVQVLGVEVASVIAQNPAANTPSPSGTTVTLWCIGG